MKEVYLVLLDKDDDAVLVGVYSNYDKARDFVEKHWEQYAHYHTYIDIQRAAIDCKLGWEDDSEDGYDYVFEATMINGLRGPQLNITKEEKE